MPLPGRAFAGSPPLVLTVAMEVSAQAYFDALRTQHFPAGRNLVPAHLTLFHALPGDQEPGILSALQRHMLHAIGRHPPLLLNVTGLMHLGRGVAFTLESAPLRAMHARLQQHWRAWLTPQDRQALRPHVVVQNKVDPATARSLHSELSAAFVPFSVVATGLTLWRYMGGPWEWAASLEFHPVNSRFR